ncbi:MAG: PilT/PilU family type 4a pilus ATPase [Candidatus Omnitrophota bacterium]
MRLDKVLRMMVDKEASDLFLRVNAPVRARIHGKIQVLDAQVLSKEEMMTLTDFILANDERRATFARNLDIDFIHHTPDIGRFRINVFTQRGTPSIVARYVTDKVQSFEDLNLPVELCRQFCNEPRGLILVCGPAGSGKSTAIASMIENINATDERHIITIEDPIEFLFKDKKSTINQRELGIDVHSYPLALRFITQQSPDLIFIGTIRDTETMAAAISAAELGALVMSTFHTINAIQTIERIINFFPPYLHAEVRMQLSLLLKGIVSLRLIPRKDGKGRIPAYETMVVTPTIARLIREGNITQIQSFIDEGQLLGMQSFKQSLVRLVREGFVEEEDARRLADSKDEFNLELRGIKRFSSNNL